jgi:AmiR/NasT family two-component response regulator
MAMMYRALIEQAKGILMERHKIKEDEAYTILTQASQKTNVTLRDVAAELVRTGAVPISDFQAGAGLSGPGLFTRDS